MEPIATMLAAGGHANSLGRSAEVLLIVRADTKRMPELFDCIYADDAWVRMRAIDTFEKLVKNDPGLADDYIERLLGELAQSDQPSIQWHLAQLFTEIDLNTLQQERAITWLQDRLRTTDVDWIVSANAMKALMHFYKLQCVDSATVMQLCVIQTAHASKTVRKKASQHTNEISGTALLTKLELD